MRSKATQISLRPEAIARALAGVAAFLVVASMAGQISTHFFGHDMVKGLVPLFNVSQEQNVPTFFSTLMILFAAFLLALITVLTYARQAADATKWAVLSIGFLYLAYDEAFSVHELLVAPFQALIGGGKLGIFYYAWVIPGIAAVSLAAAFFLTFWLRLPVRTRFLFLIASAVYVGGCIGMELLGGYYDETYRYNDLYSNMISTVEETMEMAGIIVFVYALLLYVAEHYRDVRFAFEQTGGREQAMSQGTLIRGRKQRTLPANVAASRPANP